MATRACLLDLNMWQEFYEYCDFFRDGAKLLTVLNEDLDEEDLQTVLLECLKDAPGGDEYNDKDGSVAVAQRSLVSRVFFLPSGRKVVATPEEIKLAATYIIDRFGADVDAEDAEDADEQDAPEVR